MGMAEWGTTGCAYVMSTNNRGTNHVLSFICVQNMLPMTKVWFYNFFSFFNGVLMIRKVWIHNQCFLTHCTCTNVSFCMISFACRIVRAQSCPCLSAVLLVFVCNRMSHASYRMTMSVPRSKQCIHNSICNVHPITYFLSSKETKSVLLRLRET